MDKNSQVATLEGNRKKLDCFMNEIYNPYQNLLKSNKKLCDISVVEYVALKRILSYFDCKMLNEGIMVVLDKEKGFLEQGVRNIEKLT